METLKRMWLDLNPSVCHLNMASTRASSRLVFYLVALSFVAQIALTQQDEYEYYYEEGTMFICR